MLAVIMGLALVITVPAVKWLNAEVERQKAEALMASQRDALQARLMDIEAKARQAKANANLVASQRDALQAEVKDTEAKAQAAQGNTDFVTRERDALQTQLKETEVRAQEAQKKAELATNQRTALETELKKVQEKAPLVQKIADLVAARLQATDGGPSNGEPSQNSDYTANQIESEQSQRPNTGLKAEAVASTQPLGSSVRPAQTPAMSSLASVPIEASTEARNQERGSAEAAAPIGFKSEPAPKKEPIVGVEERNR
jgi:chromosome segregation ATPase